MSHFGSPTSSQRTLNIVNNTSVLSSVTSNALVLSPGSIRKNERVEELIKCAQQQDPTKLTYIDDDDDRHDGEVAGLYLDSSESSSYYDR